MWTIECQPYERGLLHPEEKLLSVAFGYRPAIEGVPWSILVWVYEVGLANYVIRMAKCDPGSGTIWWSARLAGYSQNVGYSSQNKQWPGWVVSELDKLVGLDELLYVSSATPRWFLRSIMLKTMSHFEFIWTPPVATLQAGFAP